MRWPRTSRRVSPFSFSIQGAGLEEWREGMVDLLSTNLDGAGGLRAIDSRTVLARWREAAGATIPISRRRSTWGARRARATRSSEAWSRSVAGSGSPPTCTTSREAGSSGRARSKERRTACSCSSTGSIEILRAIGGDPATAGGVNLARATTTSPSPQGIHGGRDSSTGAGTSSGGARLRARGRGGHDVRTRAPHRLSTSYGWAESPAISPRSDRARGAVRRPSARAGSAPRPGRPALQRGTLDGVEVARLATRRYPDDPEAWYTLGEFIYHYNDMLDLKREESDAAFARALQLDPGFAPAWIHRWTWPSASTTTAPARARSRTRWRFGPAEHIRHPRPAGLADRLRRLRSGRAGLRRPRHDVDFRSLRPLRGPTLGHALPKGTGAAGRDPGAAQRKPELGAGHRGVARMGRGWIRAAVEALEDPDIRPRWAYGAYWFTVQGMPLPPDALDRILALGAVDSTDSSSLAAAWRIGTAPRRVQPWPDGWRV